MKKYRLYLFLLLAAVLLFSAIQPALALEVEYPKIGSFQISSESTLLQYIEYFFAFAIAISGIIAVITLVISGLQILVFAGSPEKINEAKEGLWAAILGIVLLFASFIIMTTINPKLVNPSTQQLPMSNPYGVFLDIQYTQRSYERWFGGERLPCSGDKCNKTTIAPESDPNIGQENDYYNTGDPALGMATMYGDTATRRIRYRCAPPSNLKDGPRLMVTVYAHEDFLIDRTNNGNAPNIRTYFLKCNTNANNFVVADSNVFVKSYKWAIEKPGVYFYLKPSCGEVGAGNTSLTPAVGATYTSIGSEVYTENSIIQPFDCEIGGGGGDWGQGEDTNTTTGTCRPREGVSHIPVCMRVINSAQEQYGTILNQSEAAIGECSAPILNKYIPEGNAIVRELALPVPNFSSDVGVGPRFAYVFKHVSATEKHPSGNIRFESNNLYNEVYSSDFTLENNRLYKLPELYGGDLNFFIKAGWLLSSGRPAAENECENAFTSCIKKTRSDIGNFRTVLYSEDELGFTDNVCQVYTCQENRFNEGNNNRWVLSSNRRVYDMYIIPMPEMTCDQS